MHNHQLRVQDMEINVAVTTFEILKVLCKRWLLIHNTGTKIPEIDRRRRIRRTYSEFGRNLIICQCALKSEFGLQMQN